MHRSLIAALAAVVLSSAAAAQEQDFAPFDHDHILWTEVLESHVQGGRVNYRTLRGDRARLDAYLGALERVTAAQLESWTREQRFSFWLNAYNAYTLRLVIDRYPVESIKDIGGLFSSVWKKSFIGLTALHPKEAGEKLCLKDIEEGILILRFRDVRVHAALNCAAASSPPLRAEAYQAKKLEEQLEDQARRWLADPELNRFEHEQHTLHLSELFDRFHKDFEREAGSVLAWVERYAPEEEVAWMQGQPKLKVKHLDFSWKLNEVVRGSPDAR